MLHHKTITLLSFGFFGILTCNSMTLQAMTHHNMSPKKHILKRYQNDQENLLKKNHRQQPTQDDLIAQAVASRVAFDLSKKSSLSQQSSQNDPVVQEMAPDSLNSLRTNLKTLRNNLPKLTTPRIQQPNYTRTPVYILIPGIVSRVTITQESVCIQQSLSPVFTLVPCSIQNPVMNM